MTGVIFLSHHPKLPSHSNDCIIFLDGSKEKDQNHNDHFHFFYLLLNGSILHQ
jgi:hypothetical protein